MDDRRRLHAERPALLDELDVGGQVAQRTGRRAAADRDRVRGGAAGGQLVGRAARGRSPARPSGAADSRRSAAGRRTARRAAGCPSARTGRVPDSTRWTSRPSTAPAAAVIRQWLDWPAPTVTSVRAPVRSASPHRNSSLRALLPPAPSPVRSSRLTHSRAPPGRPGPRSSGVGSVARRDRGTASRSSRAAHGPMVGGAARGERRAGAPRWQPMTTDWNPVLRGEFAKPYWPELQAFVRREREHHTVYPPPRRGVRRPPPHAVRDDPGADPRPGPVPRPAPGPRPVLLGAPGRAHPAVARQHPQGAARPTSASSRPATATSRRGPARACCCSTRR